MNLNRNIVQREHKKRLRARNIIFSLILGITFIFNSFASSNVYSQTEITISVEDTSIIDVLDEIEANTKLRFIFDSSIYNFNQKVSISLEKKNIEETIKAIFNNLIEYQISENLVFLKKVVSNHLQRVVTCLRRINIFYTDQRGFHFSIDPTWSSRGRILANVVYFHKCK